MADRWNLYKHPLFTPLLGRGGVGHWAALEVIWSCQQYTYPILKYKYLVKSLKLIKFCESNPFGIFFFLKNDLL